MLNVNRLRILREVAARGSFSAAAQSLSYTQSAVSQQIAALEAETGTLLVERRPRGVRLTPAGQALVEHADAIMARLESAEGEPEDMAPRLRDGEFDLGLLFRFPGVGAAFDGLHTTDLLEDPLYLALP